MEDLTRKKLNLTPLQNNVLKKTFSLIRVYKHNFALFKKLVILFLNSRTLKPNVHYTIKCVFNDKLKILKQSEKFKRLN